MYCTKYVYTMFFVAMFVVVPTVFSMESRKPEEVNLFERLSKDVLTGSVAGFAEGFTGVPFSYFKNMLQQGAEWKHLSLDPRLFYRGFPVNAFCMVPTTALQVAVDKALETTMPSNDSVWAIMRALTAGAVSAVTSTPTEMLVLHQQNQGTSLAVTARELVARGSLSSLWRGGMPKAFRDAGFAAGFLALYPRVKEEVQAATGSDTAAAFGAAITAGTITAFVTHPFDTISTCMQADPDKQKVAGVLDAVGEAYKHGGLKGFYRGLIPRTTRVALALCVMGEVKEELSNLLNKTERVDEGN